MGSTGSVAVLLPRVFMAHGHHQEDHRVTVVGVRWPNGEVSTQKTDAIGARTSYSSTEQAEADLGLHPVTFLDEILRHSLGPDVLTLPRLFRLHRTRDVSEVSGTGIVVYGAVWQDGTVTTQWQGIISSRTDWSNVDQVRTIHGHDGATELEYLDARPAWSDPHTDAVQRRDEQHASGRLDQQALRTLAEELDLPPGHEHGTERAAMEANARLLYGSFSANGMGPVEQVGPDLGQLGDPPPEGAAVNAPCPPPGAAAEAVAPWFDDGGAVHGVHGVHPVAQAIAARAVAIPNGVFVPNEALGVHPETRTVLGIDPASDGGAVVAHFHVRADGSAYQTVEARPSGAERQAVARLTTGPAAPLCNGTPGCEHSALLHVREHQFDVPRCCVVGCLCGGTVHRGE